MQEVINSALSFVIQYPDSVVRAAIRTYVENWGKTGRHGLCIVQFFVYTQAQLKIFNQECGLKPANAKQTSC
jgi:hypothetical protein